MLNTVLNYKCVLHKNDSDVDKLYEYVNLTIQYGYGHTLNYRCDQTPFDKLDGLSKAVLFSLGH